MDSLAIPGECSSAEACDDGLSCTEDVCNLEGACVGLPVHDRCLPEQLCVAGVGCTPGSPCAGPGDCDDGWFCNGQEQCDGACGPGLPPACDDGIDCTDDRCDASIDACAAAPRDDRCDDGVYCNGTESCSPPQGCVSVEPLLCDDGNPCTVEWCDEALAACLVEPRDDDGDGWSVAATPGGILCAGQDCDDADPAVHPDAAEDCANARDDDCDGALDCADVSCWGVGLCPAGGCGTAACSPLLTQGPVAFLEMESTAMPGATDDIDCWCGLPGYDGPEAVYRIPGVPAGARLIVRLSDPTVDLDLFVLEDVPGSGCVPTACLEWSTNLGTVDEFLQFPIITGGDVYVAVDGKGGAVGEFELFWAWI